jgi:hypothetical protein
VGDKYARRAPADQPTLGHQLVDGGDHCLAMDPQRARERSRARKPVAGMQPPSLDLDGERPSDLPHERHAVRAIDLECELPARHARSLSGLELVQQECDVLLLRPARPELAFRIAAPSGRSSHDRGPSTVLAGIYQTLRPADAELITRFEQQIAPILQANRVKVEGVFVTESARNTFTRLPVREGEHVLVWFGVVQHP